MSEPWEIDAISRPGILVMRFRGQLSAREMTNFVAAHNAAVDACRGADYRVFCDIRELLPLSPECTELFETAKAYSASHPNFQGSAVLMSSQLVAMQHKRTSVAGGVWSSELMSADEAACWAHLSSVTRARLSR
jgi:hypothetical protein